MSKLLRFPSESQQYPEWVEFGSLLHTALRKCCDSSITSIAYNIIDGMGETWGLFPKMLLAAIEDGVLRTESKEEFTADLQRMCSFGSGNATFTFDYCPKFSPRQQYGREAEWLLREPPNRALWNALIICISLFDDTDLKGFVSYLFA